MRMIKATTGYITITNDSFLDISMLSYGTEIILNSDISSFKVYTNCLELLKSLRTYKCYGGELGYKKQSDTHIINNNHLTQFAKVITIDKDDGSGEIDTKHMKIIKTMDIRGFIVECLNHMIKADPDNRDCRLSLFKPQAHNGEAKYKLHPYADTVDINGNLIGCKMGTIIIEEAFRTLNYSNEDWAIMSSDKEGSLHTSLNYHTNHSSSGEGTEHLSLGELTNQASSGAATSHESRGDKCVVMSTGYRSQVKGVRGTLVALTHYKNGEPKKIVTGRIGWGGLKPDTWYGIDENGKFIKLDY